MTKSSREEKEPSSTEAPVPIDKSNKTFLVAAIGASAGGIEAFTELIKNLSIDTGMAFVLIQHLDPKHHSILAELIARQTKMPATEVADGMELAPNCIYVIPPNRTMCLKDYTLRLRPREEMAGGHMPIDHFMRSLAEEQGPRSLGVILSGLGSDGTVGLCEIQAQGGVTFAQDEASAKYNSMPRSAAMAGCVDYVLPPKGIARELARIAKHPYLKRASPEGAELIPGDNASLHSIFQLLRRSTGLDFTHYRQTTILRRIQRRMVVHKIDELNQYVKYVQANPSEIKSLYQDMLINVTSFFRNPGVFEAMKTEVFPNIFANRSSDLPVRVWTPGCSSGEETYSIAITLLEYFGKKAQDMPIQFFGTDVNETSVAKARMGTYPENILGDVSEERLQRFFTKTERGYRISKSIRDMCLFARHNLLSNPPFSQMDIVSCRNLLIYLEPGLQARVISLFHYSVRSTGYLILGSSEGIGTSSNLFSIVDRTHKIFGKKASAARQVVTFSLIPQADREGFSPAPTPAKQLDSSSHYLEAQKEFDRRLLAQYAPAAVFINEDLDIIHTRGNVSGYLKLAPGRASLNILKMARQGLLRDLRNAIAQVKKDRKPIRKQNIQGKGDGTGHGAEDGGARGTRLVNFEIIPIRISNLNESYFMILFQDVVQEPAKPAPLNAKRTRAFRLDANQVTELAEELTATKEHLQSVIETQEATNDQLQSANEEILSSNEELQSTNEQLETAKEELQSANEELTTVNDELRGRNREVTLTNSDLTNLLGAIDLAVVIVGSDLTIRRFTPRAEKMMGLLQTDVGRPFRVINPSMEVADLHQLVLQVISTSNPIEKEAPGYHLRILPYRTPEGNYDGAVITLSDDAAK